jgi:hypothetical protein
VGRIVVPEVRTPVVLAQDSADVTVDLDPDLEAAVEIQTTGEDEEGTHHLRQSLLKSKEGREEILH